MNFKILYIAFVMIFSGSCSNGKKTLTLEASHPDLVLVNGVLEFSNIAFSGKLITYYPNGHLESEIQYVGGKKHGYEKRWLTNGALYMERFYTNGFKSGTHKAWWENGSLKFEYHFNDNGEYDGSVKEWYETGQPYMSFNYENGKESGSQRLWKADGRIKANYEVVNDERFGLIGLKKCYTVTVNSDEVK